MRLAYTDSYLVSVKCRNHGQLLHGSHGPYKYVSPFARRRAQVCYQRYGSPEGFASLYTAEPRLFSGKWTRREI